MDGKVDLILTQKISNVSRKFYRNERNCSSVLTRKTYTIAAMMDWDPGFRYKLLGRPVKAGGETLLAFDLTSAQAYPLEGKSPAPVLPGDWRGQFGLPAAKHARAVEVPVFDSHAVHAICPF